MLLFGTKKKDLCRGQTAQPYLLLAKKNCNQVIYPRLEGSDEGGGVQLAEHSHGWQQRSPLEVSTGLVIIYTPEIKNHRLKPFSPT